MKSPFISRLFPLSVLVATLAVAQEQSVKPGINEKFLDPSLKPGEWTQRFETESREIFHQREKIVAAVGLKPGQVVASLPSTWLSSAMCTTTSSTRRIH